MIRIDLNSFLKNQIRVNHTVPKLAIQELDLDPSHFERLIRRELSLMLADRIMQDMVMIKKDYPERDAVQYESVIYAFSRAELIAFICGILETTNNI
jgi:hypothetical protein